MIQKKAEKGGQKNLKQAIKNKVFAVNQKCSRTAVLNL